MTAPVSDPGEVPLPGPPRLVLDTNVCLDLFVFDDPRCTSLHMALRDGAVIAVTDDACREEWRRVLPYPVLRLDEAARAAALARYDAVLQRLAPDAELPANALQAPRCRDPDDQKFLDLALRAGARWLLSRDAHLLSLARRTRRDGLFEILPPEAWLAARSASA
ncbi:putative toxin-antitoxin system toxin component, PIN family [Lysobacter yangpyeongensis]|uniref:putative toxin-antitoxin system toxin component, PIN family n=1 Tax=Lysobacter yangpyeongensis TaxID=346182 RepID=UPI0036DB3841